MSNNPLLEVFGYPCDNFSADARDNRESKICPFDPRGVPCTKDKKADPLGVCTLRATGGAAIICPSRFYQNGVVIENAARFLFPTGTRYTLLKEVHLKDGEGKSTGNIDLVLVALDERGSIYDYGALEIQSVYISGNVRNPFRHYMKAPERHCNMDWTGHKFYPRPDYLSSSRKRLVPQLIYKGAVLHAWGKRTTVAVHRGFFETLPVLPQTSRLEAQMAWFVYDLEHDFGQNRYHLVHSETIYTEFKPALDRILTALPGSDEEFRNTLRQKLKREQEKAKKDSAAQLPLFVLGE